MTNPHTTNQAMIDAVRLMNDGWSFRHDPCLREWKVTAKSPDGRVVIEATSDRNEDALRVACLLARMANILPL